MKYNDYELLDLIYENDEVAYNIMINKYKPLVYARAKKYYNRAIINNYIDLSLDDFINEGLLTLDRAIKNFDPDKGYLFYSFLFSCLNSNFNIMLRNLFSLKNKPLLHYHELEFEINDIKQINPYDYISLSFVYEKLKEYLFTIDFIDSAILELRLNNFKYREIVELLNVSSTRINRVINKTRKYLDKFDII